MSKNPLPKQTGLDNRYRDGTGDDLVRRANSTLKHAMGSLDKKLTRVETQIDRVLERQQSKQAS